MTYAIEKLTSSRNYRSLEQQERDQILQYFDEYRTKDGSQLEQELENLTPNGFFRTLAPQEPIEKAKRKTLDLILNDNTNKDKLKNSRFYKSLEQSKQDEISTYFDDNLGKDEEELENQIEALTPKGYFKFLTKQDPFEKTKRKAIKAILKEKQKTTQEERDGFYTLYNSHKDKSISDLSEIVKEHKKKHWPFDELLIDEPTDEELQNYKIVKKLLKQKKRDLTDQVRQSYLADNLCYDDEGEPISYTTNLEAKNIDELQAIKKGLEPLDFTDRLSLYTDFRRYDAYTTVKEVLNKKIANSGNQNAIQEQIKKHKPKSFFGWIPYIFNHRAQNYVSQLESNLQTQE
jgi:hypothetical protein